MIAVQQKDAPPTAPHGTVVRVSRQLRVQFAGALYHVMARGNNREPIVHDERDVVSFLGNLEATCERYAWRVFGWCIMPNHYHLVLETARETLSYGMRRLNSVYAQQFNQRHNRVGHFFQGRFRAFVVGNEDYLLTLLRYVELNPWRAALVQHPTDWPWSSIHVSLGRDPAPPWSAVREVWARFGTTAGVSIKRYREFLFDGMHTPAEVLPMHHSLVIGDAEAAAGVEALAGRTRVSPEIPHGQRVTSAALPAIFAREADVDAAIKDAYVAGFPLRAIAAYLGVHYSTVSVIARRTTPRKRGSIVALRAVNAPGIDVDA